MNPSVSLTSDSQKPPFRGGDVRRRLDDHRIDVSRKGRWRPKQAGEPALDSGQVLRAAVPVQFVHGAYGRGGGEHDDSVRDSPPVRRLDPCRRQPFEPIGFREDRGGGDDHGRGMR